MSEAPNKPNLRLWVDALRSGFYAQATGRLYADGGFCCLGVACEVAMANGVSLTFDPEWQSYDGRISDLPEAVAVWLGVEDLDPFIDKRSGVTACMANDFLEWPFTQIADAVEEFYELKVEAVDG